MCGSLNSSLTAALGVGALDARTTKAQRIGRHRGTESTEENYLGAVTEAQRAEDLLRALGRGAEFTEKAFWEATETQRFCLSALCGCPFLRALSGASEERFTSYRRCRGW